MATEEYLLAQGSRYSCSSAAIETRCRLPYRVKPRVKGGRNSMKSKVLGLLWATLSRPAANKNWIWPEQKARLHGIGLSERLAPMAGQYKMNWCLEEVMQDRGATSLTGRKQHHTNTGTIRTNRAADHCKNPRRASIAQDLHGGLLCDETTYLARFSGRNATWKVATSCGEGQAPKHYHLVWSIPNIKDIVYYYECLKAQQSDMRKDQALQRSAV
ncbi:hypothetical protein MCOR02_007120 [Pyricularia oryzae]|uniref:Uncharacterized protein n=2 Tax=Pyricularia TaxID=48558 RepID=A0A4P7NR28_PYROR|nr:hypothetical protein MCOR02_007120 [Pyricularia oryzae]KAI6317410.1 hypothetical protein MCOR29_006307 [Pyricularia oryzae]KAI6512208.1 hypothetical protein MCOR13_000021 [Pyricularia oryzae]QBZ64827.1 hypothetical protein PoMZ_06528 [Pyricularia oryzae]